MSPRRKLLLLLIVAGTTALYALWRLPDWAAHLVEQALGGVFHRKVEVESLGVRWKTLEIEIRGLRVAGLTPDAPPFIEAPLVRLRPSLAPIRRDRIAFSRVRLDGLRVRINAFRDPPLGRGGDDIPKLGGGNRRGLQLGIERLVVVGGEFVLDHMRVPLELDLPSFRGRLTRRAGGALGGRVSFEPGRLRMGDGPELPVGTEIDLVFDRGLLIVEGARLVAENTHLTYYGRLRLTGRPQGQFWLDGPIDLRVLETHVFRSGLGFAGQARWAGLLSVDGSRLRIEGRIDGRDGRFMGVDVPRYSSLLSYDGTSGLVMRELDVSALGGTGLLAIVVPPTSTGRPVQIRGAMRDGDGEGLLRMIFGWGPLGIGAAATGEVDVRWPRGRPRLVSGTIGADLGPRPDGRLPLEGRIDWSAREGLQKFDRVELRGPWLRGRAAGEVDPAERANLAIEGETKDLGATDALFMRVRRALGSPEAVAAGVTGAGAFQGHWRGTLEWPVFEGRFSGRHVGYAGVNWGAAEWSGRFDTAAESVESRSLVLRKEGSELWWDGRTEIGWFGQRDAVDGRVRMTSWPIEDIVRFMDWQIEATGRVSGQANVRGRRSAPEGEANVTASAGRYYSVPFQSAHLESRWKGRLAEVTRGEVRLGGGRAGFRGTLDDDGVYDGAGEMEGVDLGTLVPAPAPGVEYGGRLSGSMVFQGTLARPRLVASLSSPRLFVADEGIGALAARLVATGDGRVQLDAQCRSARVDVRLAGSVGAAPPFDADLSLSGRDTSLDPFLRAIRPAFPPSLGLLASGEVRLQGPLQDPVAVRAEATVPDLQILVPDFTVRSPDPVRVTLADGRLRLERLHLAGEGTDLEVEGGGDVLGDGPLSLTARGIADLRALSLLTRRLRGSGTARLSANLSGTRRAPRLRGTLELDDAALRVRGFPHGLEGLRGRVRFSETAAELEGVNASLAGGRLALEGQASYGGGRLSYDLYPTGRGIALRYPEGARTLLDARLRLFGDSSQRWITGTVDVRQALYTRRYDVASELLAGGRSARAAAGSNENTERLDLHVRAPGTLRVDNNLATLTARADLHVQGTTSAPAITGRAEIERGRVYFQGRTYVVQRGSLDFVDPQRLVPLFDIEGETRIRAYRVTLRVAGTLERVTPTLSSDPPLSSLQILALLAGQDESEVANLTQTEARQSQGQLAKAGAATLAAGRLSETVGLEREAQRLFGLNRFSIDPSLLRGAGTTPTARVTVGKRLGPDVNVLYSRDLKGTEERILAIEYNLSDRLSLLLTHTDPGSAKTGVERGLALDVRVRQSRR